MKAISIAGGGLAGLSLALALRRQGIPVSVHEASTYPRHRVCGEFISGLDLATRSLLGLEDAFSRAVSHWRTTWYFGNDRILEAPLPERALGLSRHFLDDWLQRAFQAAGGELHLRSRVQDNVTQGEGWVSATGRLRHQKSPWLGVKAHFLQVKTFDGLEMHLGRELYVGVTRVEAGRVNVCALVRAPWKPSSAGTAGLLQLFEQRGLPGLAERLSEAQGDERSLTGVSALGFGGRVPRADGTCRVGDGMALIPPFSGNGMTMAFQSARCLVDVLEAYARGRLTWDKAVHEGNRRHRKLFSRRLRTARILHPALTQPVGQRFLAALARRRLIPFQTVYHLLR